MKNKTNKIDWWNDKPVPLVSQQLEDKDKKEEGLIQKLIRKYQFKKQFTKKELEEIEKIKKEAFMKEIRKYAKEEGIKLAKKDIEESLKGRLKKDV